MLRSRVSTPLYTSSPYETSFGTSHSSDLPYSCHQQIRRGWHPLVKALLGALVSVVLLMVIYMVCGSEVEFKDVKLIHRNMHRQEDSSRTFQPSPGRRKLDEPSVQAGHWDRSVHSLEENIAHEEMKGDDEFELKNDIKGLKKRAKMFFKLDRNQDGFLAGADLPRETLGLLDTNNDEAVAFPEWCHGFWHMDHQTKLDIFKKHYKDAYGNLLPENWRQRTILNKGKRKRGENHIEDDRHELHEMDHEKHDRKRKHQLSLIDKFQKADINSDSKLSQKEAMPIIADFKKADLDLDGVVDFAEYISHAGVHP